MIHYEQLKKKASVFKGFSGVTVEEFEGLEAKVEPIWLEHEGQRLARSDRQRAEGGGRKPTLPFREQLLMTLIWLRLYLVLEVLGYLFGVDKSSASRYTRRMLPALRQVGERTLGWPEPPKRGQGKGLEQLREEHPDLFAFVDATEQAVQRSSDNETQKRHYSGKKKRHTRKTQIIVNEEGVVRDVSASTPGSMHDRKHFTHSGAADKIPKEVTVGGDAGYQGIHHDCPDHEVITPFKKSKHHPLTAEEKMLNQEFAAARIVVENTLCQFKQFDVLAHRFRHALHIYDDVFRAVLAIVNPRILARVASANAA